MATSPPAGGNALQSERFLSRRQQLLEAGAELVEEAALQGRLPEFTVDDLLRRVPGQPTRGAFTNCWARKEDYERDLVTALLDTRSYQFVDDLADRLMPLVEAGAPLPELIRVGSKIHFENFRDSPYFHLNLLLTNMARHPDWGPFVRNQLIETYAQAGKEFEDLYRWLLVAYRLRIREGLTLADLSATLGAVIEGFAFRWIIDPDPVRDDITFGDDEVWSMVAVTIDAVVLRFTESVDND